MLKRAFHISIQINIYKKRKKKEKKYKITKVPFPDSLDRQPRGSEGSDRLQSVTRPANVFSKRPLAAAVTLPKVEDQANQFYLNG